jgi:ABC-2 type transport system permease protein
MLSLEGKKFWILGLLPLRRQRLLWGKFVFSAVGSLVIAEGLIVVSDVMLDMPFFTLALHALTVGVLAVGLSGLSVGLGACMPTFQETDPSKIAAGFGGTLNLVAELMLLIGVIVLIALPWHAQVALVKPEPGVSRNDLLSLLGVVPGVAVGALGAWLPMRAGARALARMEF